MDNGRKIDIVILKKDRGDIFLGCHTENFKAKFLSYFNEVLFEMVKIALNYTYLGEKTTTALKNEVSICRHIYYYEEARVVVNQAVNYLYAHLLFEIDALLQDAIFPLDMASTFFKNLSPGAIDLLI